MASDVRVWAVDVSGYELWTQANRGADLIDALLFDDDERGRVKRFVREMDQIRTWRQRMPLVNG